MDYRYIKNIMRSNLVPDALAMVQYMIDHPNESIWDDVKVSHEAAVAWMSKSIPMLNVIFNMACEYAQTECVQLLISHVDVNVDNGSCFYEALRSKNKINFLYYKLPPSYILHN